MRGGGVSKGVDLGTDLGKWLTRTLLSQEVLVSGQ